MWKLLSGGIVLSYCFTVFWAANVMNALHKMQLFNFDQVTAADFSNFICLVNENPLNSRTFPLAKLLHYQSLEHLCCEEREDTLERTRQEHSGDSFCWKWLNSAASKSDIWAHHKSNSRSIPLDVSARIEVEKQWLILITSFKLERKVETCLVIYNCFSSSPPSGFYLNSRIHEFLWSALWLPNERRDVNLTYS